MGTGRVTLYIATSVDGYIADEEGSVDWLEEFRSEDAGGFSEFFGSVDCLVMGATTYEQVLEFGEWPYGETATYVFTHRDLPPATDAVEFVDDDVATLSQELKRQYEHVWLVGGANLAQSFLREQAIDDLRLFFVPVLLGEGVRLFSGEYTRHRLRLHDSVSEDGGLVEHHYEIVD